MRATKLTATVAAVVCAAVPVVMGQASASAASTHNTASTHNKVSTFVVEDGSQQGRELEIIRGQASDNELEIIRGDKRLRSLTLRADSARELEIIRGFDSTSDELEITRVGRP